MNRASLIARLSHLVYPSVLDALSTDWMRQAVAALDASQSSPVVDFKLPAHPRNEGIEKVINQFG